ncbi:nucleoporin NUP42-like [Uloborus diversus]|uniref:nucleoporin NUP42-like n=1 Tax=Uloborus diversus TaxID=327109 RepID=UPI00240A2881|nr:nucleoporin NUP42-like [Uloborus diversus]
MTVCRFFLQGTCRFGDRCRFEHPDPSNQNRNSQGYGYGRTGQTSYSENRPSRYTDYSYSSNYNTYDKPASNYRYDSPNRFSNDSAYRSDRNQYKDHRYSNESTNRPDRNQYNYNRYGNDNYYYSEVDFESEPNNAHEKFNRGNTHQKIANEQRYSSNDSYSDNTYGQNRFRWLSADYKQKSQFNKSAQSDYQTSTPKAASSFSFKVPESEIKTYQNVAPTFSKKIDENDQIFAELVKEDATAWELGEQWPFTCYYPDPSKTAFPGFSDISAEELRFEAYKAKENNSYSAYVEIVNSALLDVKQKRDQLKVLTPELLSILARIRKGEDLSKESTFAEPLSLFQNETETMISESVSDTASNFSFKLPTNDSAIKTSAASFSFRLPSQAGSKPTRTTSSSLPVTETENYTPLEQLTESEKEQFLASTFTLGKIPTKPPPSALCF